MSKFLTAFRLLDRVAVDYVEELSVKQSPVSDFRSDCTRLIARYAFGEHFNGFAIGLAPSY